MGKQAKLRSQRRMAKTSRDIFSLYQQVSREMQAEGLAQRTLSKSRPRQMGISKSSLVSPELTLGEVWSIAKQYIPSSSMWEYFYKIDSESVDMNPDFTPPIELSYSLREALYCVVEGILIGGRLALNGCEVIGSCPDAPTFNMLFNMSKALDLAGHVASRGQHLWEENGTLYDEAGPELQLVFDLQLKKSADMVCAPAPLSPVQSGECMMYLRQYRQSEFYDYCPEVPKPCWW